MLTLINLLSTCYLGLSIGYKLYLYARFVQRNRNSNILATINNPTIIAMITEFRRRYYFKIHLFLLCGLLLTPIEFIVAIKIIRSNRHLIQKFALSNFFHNYANIVNHLTHEQLNNSPHYQTLYDNISPMISQYWQNYWTTGSISGNTIRNQQTVPLDCYHLEYQYLTNFNQIKLSDEQINQHQMIDLCQCGQIETHHCPIKATIEPLAVCSCRLNQMLHLTRQQTEIVCPILTDEFTTHTRIGIMGCGHYATYSALETWYQSNQSCPICRKRNHMSHLDDENTSSSNPEPVPVQLQNLLPTVIVSYDVYNNSTILNNGDQQHDNDNIQSTLNSILQHLNDLDNSTDSVVLNNGNQQSDNIQSALDVILQHLNNLDNSNSSDNNTSDNNNHSDDNTTASPSQEASSLYSYNYDSSEPTSTNATLTHTTDDNEQGEIVVQSDPPDSSQDDTIVESHFIAHTNNDSPTAETSDTFNFEQSGSPSNLNQQINEMLTPVYNNNDIIVSTSSS